MGKHPESESQLFTASRGLGMMTSFLPQGLCPPHAVPLPRWRALLPLPHGTLCLVFGASAQWRQLQPPVPQPICPEPCFIFFTSRTRLRHHLDVYLLPCALPTPLPPPNGPARSTRGSVHAVVQWEGKVGTLAWSALNL